MPTMGQGPDSRYGKGQEITIRTGSGLTGSVFVPESQYAADLVRPILASLAARLEAVHKLSG